MSTNTGAGQRTALDSIAYALCANDESTDPTFSNDELAALIHAQLVADGHLPESAPAGNTAAAILAQLTAAAALIDELGGAAIDLSVASFPTRGYAQTVMSREAVFDPGTPDFTVLVETHPYDPADRECYTAAEVVAEYVRQRATPTGTGQAADR